MNAQAKSVILMKQYNSYGALLRDVEVPLELVARLNKSVESCKRMQAHTFFRDFKSGLEFFCSKDGFQLMPEAIVFQGPCLPRTPKKLSGLDSQPTPIYTNRRYQGD